MYPPNHPWPVGTACYLSRDGLLIHDPRWANTLIYILGVVESYVSPDIPFALRPLFSHPSFDNTALEDYPGWSYYTTLPDGDGVLIEHEVVFASVQLALITDEAVRSFLLPLQVPESLAVYAHFRQTHTPYGACRQTCRALLASHALPHWNEPGSQEAQGL